MRRLAAAVVPVLLLGAASCEPASSTSAGSSTTSASAPASTTTGPPASGVDPLVPYSPAPAVVTDRTSGFAGDTLAVADSAGGTMHVTLLSTAISPVTGPDGRAFSLWLTVENADGPAWSGYPGGFVTVGDASGALFQPVPSPRRAELHPDPQRYGASNRNLHQPMTIGAGKTVSGVSLFHIPGGYRPVTVSISFDKGTTWVIWQTSFGPS